MKEGVKIYHKELRDIYMRVVPGHFVTSHSHINYYFDMTTMKIRQNEAKAVADLLCESCDDDGVRKALIRLVSIS